MTRAVHIAIPTYTGEIGAPTVTSVLRAMEEARALGWRATLDIRSGDSLLPRCRNAMLQRFLDSSATDLVFWDADIAAAPGGFAQLLSHDVDAVAGCYRARSDPERYIFRPLAKVEDPDTGLLEVEGVGAGFLRLTRAGLERTAVHFPDLWVADRALGRLTWLFDNALINHEYYSEDFVFCQRFRAASGKVWIDPDLALHHTGAKTFTGRYADHWRGQLAARTPPDDLAADERRLSDLTETYLQPRGLTHA